MFQYKKQSLSGHSPACRLHLEVYILCQQYRQTFKYVTNLNISRTLDLIKEPFPKSWALDLNLQKSKTSNMDTPNQECIQKSKKIGPINNLPFL